MICTADQLSRMEKVIAHNEGTMEIQGRGPDGVRVLVFKSEPAGPW